MTMPRHLASCLYLLLLCLQLGLAQGVRFSPAGDKAVATDDQALVHPRGILQAVVCSQGQDIAQGGVRGDAADAPAGDLEAGEQG